MKGIKKILSMVLAIVCIIGLFPTAKEIGSKSGSINCNGKWWLYDKG